MESATGGDKVAIIGFGVMGEALGKSFIRAGVVPAEKLYASDIQTERLEAARKLGARASSDRAQVVRSVDTIIIAVKPQDIPALLEEIRPAVTEDHTIISIAAGIPTTSIEKALVKPVPVIRVMPNLACVVGEGMLAFARGRWARDSHVRLAVRLLSSSGRVIEVHEPMMDAVTGLSGSGPAFVAVLVQALADAGVRVGFHRKVALTMAIQTVLGTAKMLMETGIHPEALKDMVASPGGTAIAGIHAMESKGIRAALMDAVVAATERSRELGKKAPAFPMEAKSAAGGNPASAARSRRGRAGLDDRAEAES